MRERERERERAHSGGEFVDKEKEIELSLKKAAEAPTEDSVMCQRLHYADTTW